MKVHSYYETSQKQEFRDKAVTITIDAASNQYISAFRYGSVVMFNVPKDSHMEHLEKIREAANAAPLADGLQYTDDYNVYVDSNLAYPAVIKPKHLNIRNLDSNNLTIIGTVIAQSVAIDYHFAETNRFLDLFSDINTKIESTGSFKGLQVKEMYKIMAANNRVIVSVLYKMGIFEGTDVAWDNSEYADTFAALRTEFEIESRYNDLESKLNLVKDNFRFFTEVSHADKSHTLEWYIIILITVEIGINLTEFL
jgi:uncharacterized Rmd1/YagE family protein